MVAADGTTPVALRLLSIKLGIIGRLVIGAGMGVREKGGKGRREAPAVACFRLSALLYAADKATLDNLRDGRCRMKFMFEENVMVVCGLGYCQGAQT
ncbi:unnamed protein product [Dicrocoelium dendriticum]|nr:unnamed protein product [Dicrocoelium dendriticum]